MSAFVATFKFKERGVFGEDLAKEREQALLQLRNTQKEAAYSFKYKNSSCEEHKCVQS